jgi:chloramphenicol-sensitive protein RarD
MLLDAVSAYQIVANRIVWSLCFVLILLLIRNNWAPLIDVLRSRRSVVLLAVAAATISINWGVYAYAITNDQVLEASLGYFINPLVSVLIGVVLLRERLRHLQWTAVGIGAISVVILTISYGRRPWISLILAFTFAIYGLMKKLANSGALESLAVETLLLLPIALLVMAIFANHGQGVVTNLGHGTAILLILLGPITAVPLLAFSAAATRIPLSTLGIIQYITPSIQFILGITVFAAVVSPVRWLGVSIIWLALIVFAIDTVRHSRAVSRNAERTSIIDTLEVTVPD